MHQKAPRIWKFSGGGPPDPPLGARPVGPRNAWPFGPRSFNSKKCAPWNSFQVAQLANWTFTLSFITVTHRGRVTHICVSKLTNIGSDNGLSPGWRQAIIWTNVGILLIGTLGTNFTEISIDIHTFSFKKMRMKVLSAKRRTFCLGLNVLCWNRKIFREN